MLLLSNNALVASSGSWLMGYLPEQQLDLLLGYAIADGRQRFAIIAEDSAFESVWQHMPSGALCSRASPQRTV